MATLQDAQLRSEDDVLVLTLSLRAELGLPEGLRAALVLHDDVEVTPFAWWINCEQTGVSWQGRLPVMRAAGKGRVFELVQVVDATGTLLSIEGKHFFLEPQENGDWRTGLIAEGARAQLQSAREARFNGPIVSSAAKAADPVFTVIMLADNLYLTRQQRVPGIQILPVSQSTLGADMVDVLNAVLPQRNFGTLINKLQWMEQMRRKRPVAVLYIPKVRASNEDDAVRHCKQLVHQLLDLLALKRGDAPRLLCGVVGAEDSGGMISSKIWWIEGAGYTGNLLGGYTSGEDPHGLIQSWNGLSVDPRTRLWLSLYSDAISDERWDYRVFRCFNLLEGIASQVVPGGSVIRDDKGNPRLMPNGKFYKTDQARGRIYELLRKVSAKRQEAERSFTSPAQNGPPIELWDEIRVWVGIRNAVAHRGSWELPPGVASSAQDVSTESLIASRGGNGSFADGAWRVGQAIRTAVESTLRLALREKL